MAPGMPNAVVKTHVLNGLTLLCLGLAACPCAYSQDVSGPLGLWDQATLYRDAWGVPHVYAETPRALGFAFGHAQARSEERRVGNEC